jgi:hypothetical protein
MSTTAKRSNSSGFLALLQAGPVAAPLVEARQALHLNLLVAEALAEVTQAEARALRTVEAEANEDVTHIGFTSLLGR